MSKELMIERIEKAQKEIEAKRETVQQGKFRQDYHFMAETGWINDPNGLIYFKGKYHFFYQYNPYSGFWDCMHWGHAVSEDMIHWEYLPLALAPSEVYDDHSKGGCFSGSAIEHDGKLFLIYTGTCNNGNGFEQAQCIAYSEDGIHFEKYEGNPVITAPEGVPTDLFRDPKIWKHDDTYYVVCGASKNGFAQARLYKSTDMFHWEFVNVLAESRGEWGYMWECPDFYPVGDKYVLMFSPMGGKERTSVYLVGWANAWDWMPFWKDWGPTYQEGWCGFFNIPREAVLAEDNTLKFVPVKELQDLRKNKQEEADILIKEDEKKELRSGCVYETEMRINLKKSTADKIRLNLRMSQGKKTEILFDLKRAEAYFDRNNSDGWSKGVARCPLNLMGKEHLDIHIYSDKISLEIFSNDYQNNFSCNIYNMDDDQKSTAIQNLSKLSSIT